MTIAFDRPLLLDTDYSRPFFPLVVSYLRGGFTGLTVALLLIEPDCIPFGVWLQWSSLFPLFSVYPVSLSLPGTHSSHIRASRRCHPPAETRTSLSEPRLAPPLIVRFFLEKATGAVF